MIKLIVTDLDGTLLNHDRKVSKTNENTIRKLQDEGYLVCFASGRPFQGMDCFAQQCDLASHESYFITNTGSKVFDYKNSKLISSHTLDVQDYKYICGFIKDLNVQIAGYTEDTLYSFSKVLNPALIHDQKILDMDLKYIDPEQCDEKFGRFNIMGSKESVDEAVSRLPKEFFDSYYTVRNETFSFEVLNKKSGKGNALETLTSYLNVDLDSEVLTIGDNFNDLEMLKITGNSVSMGQSCSEIQSQTKYVTSSNDDDGFSKIITKMLPISSPIAAPLCLWKNKYFIFRVNHTQFFTGKFPHFFIIRVLR